MATYSSKTELNGSAAPTGLGPNYSTQGKLSTFNFPVNNTTIQTHVEVDSGGGQNSVSLVGPDGRPLGYYTASTNTWSPVTGSGGNIAAAQAIVTKINSTPGLANALSQSAYYTTLHKTGNANQATQITGVSPTTPAPKVAPVPQGTNPTSPGNQQSTSQFGLPTGKDFKDILTGISTNFGAGDEEPRPIYIYPVDAIYSGKNSNQDYLQISKYRYNPPYAESLFTDQNILKTGLKRGEATQEKLLGQVLLPIPNNIADSNNVAWADDNMNNLSAAALNMGLNNPALLGFTAGAGGFLGLLNGNPLGGAQKGAAAGIYYQLLQAALGSNNPNAKTIGTAAGASKVLSMAGFQMSPESILARGAGIIPNSNLELLFNAPTIREFTFQYRLSPRGSGEADEVKHIIKFFKRGMAPKKQNSTSGSGSSYFLGTPNVFKLNYKTSGSKEIDGVNKIKTCAMTGFSVNYAADGSWAAYDGGQPVSYILNMSFKELEPVYDADYNLSDSTVGY